MPTRPRRLPRAILPVAALALAFATSACRMEVDVSTVLAKDGSGTFTIVFAFDRELIEIVEETEEGRASLQQLRDVAASFDQPGWTVASAEPGGGLRITITRPFTDAADLEAAIRAVGEAQADAPLAFTKVFRDFRIEHDPGFFAASSRVAGRVDLTPERLAPNFGKASAELQQALRQAARTVFAFRVRVALPGSIDDVAGDPESASGGVAVWSARFGEETRFSAASGGTRVGSVALVAGPAIAALALGAFVAVRSRRRRRADVLPGWEVEAGSE